MKKQLLFYFIIIILLVYSKKASATSYTWLGSTSTLWNVAANWAPSGIPGSSDDVIIPATTLFPTVNVATTCQSITVDGTTIITVSAPLTISGALSIDGNLTFAGTSSIAIIGATTFGYDFQLVVGASNTVNFLSGSTLTMGGNNLNTITNNGKMYFAGSTFTYGFQTAFINNGTVSLATTIFDGSSNSFRFSNSGTLQLSSSTIFTLNDFSTLVNTGTITSTASTFVLQGSSSTPTCQINNTGHFTATTTTFTLSGTDANIQNTGSAVFAANSCIFTVSGSGAIANTINNTATFNDNSSIFTFTGQGATLENTGATANMHLSGSVINFANGSNGNSQIINNTGIFKADAATVITLGTYASKITNSGTFYAGTSGSACTINLNAQSSLITNSHLFFLGSTSIIYPTAISTSVTNTSTGVFTLESDANGTASIGPLNTSTASGEQAVFTGKFSVQRFFQGNATYDAAKGRWLGRNYRIISSAVNTGTPVNGNNVFGLNYIVGATAGETTTANSTTNAFVTGAIGGSTSAGNPTLYVYRESLTPNTSSYTAGNFVGITNITNSTTLGTIGASDGKTYSIPIGNGVWFFFRGAATQFTARTKAPFIAPENVILTSAGALNQQAITVRNWYTPTSPNIGYTGSSTGGNYAVRGYNMVGNPYPCAIDWNAYFTGGIKETNILPIIYQFNPVTNQYDSYMTTSASTGVSTGNASNIIASGQGFLIRASTTGASLTFNETAKSPTSQPLGSSLLMGTPVQNAVQQLLRLKLTTDSLNYDDIVIGFNSTASVNYNQMEDGCYMLSPAALEGLSSFSADGIPLGINFLPLPKQGQQVIHLDVEAKQTGTYTLQKTELDAIPQLYEVWLMDSYKRDSLDIRKNSTYIFDIDLNDTASFGKNRFEVVVRQNTALMVHLLNFTAAKSSVGAQVIWKTENEQNYTNFTVERSSNGGVTFDVLGGFVSNALGTYSFLDTNPPIGSDKYRLKMEDLNGTITYSNIVTLIYGNGNNIVSHNLIAYPNPTRNIINLAINNTSNNISFAIGNSPLQNSSIRTPLSGTPTNIQSSYDIKIVSVTGLVVKEATSSQPNWQYNVGALTPGTYFIQVINKNNDKLVGRITFVKL